MGKPNTNGEPTEIVGNDLEERLINARTWCELALFLIKNERWEFIPTVLELLYEGVHLMLERYCIKELVE